MCAKIAEVELNCYFYIAVLETIQLWSQNEFVEKFYLQNVFTNHVYLIHVYKQDLGLYNQEGLICH